MFLTLKKVQNIVKTQWYIYLLNRKEKIILHYQGGMQNMMGHGMQSMQGMSGMGNMQSMQGMQGMSMNYGGSQVIAVAKNGTVDSIKPFL